MWIIYLHAHVWGSIEQVTDNTSKHIGGGEYLPNSDIIQFP